MTLDEPTDGRCNHPTDDGGYCARYPAVDSDGVEIDGKCSFHGDGGTDGRATHGHQRAVKHGLYSQPSNYYYHLDRRDQIWIDLLVESFLEDAPFDRENAGKMELLRQVAIDLHKVRRANEYIWDEGIAQVKDAYDSVDGEVQEFETENILNLPVDRLERQITKRLKELGVLEDPESRRAESDGTLAVVLAGLTED